MKIKPWQYESGSLPYNNEILNYIYLNKNITNFLEIGDHDHNLVLIGPKGVGKTLFLNLKSFLTREHYAKKGVKIYPSTNQLCENLMLDNRTIGKHKLIRFVELSLWKKIWRFLISIIACKTANIHIENQTLKEMLENGNSFSNLLTIILSDRSNLNKYLDLLPLLTRKIETINAGVLIFLDNIDQEFGQFLAGEHTTDFTALRQSPSVRVWTNAQVGLMGAIYDLNRHNSHIKVYSSVRAEAFKCLESEMILNYKNYTTSLIYTKEELKKIFEKNIQLMPKEEKIKNKKNDLMYSFLGVKNIPHFLVKNGKNKSVEENTFDFIYRHTMGRPREIVFMGYYIYIHVISESGYKELSEKNKIKKIKKAVFKVSNEVIDVYLNEIVPRFDKELLTEFVKFIQSNVIPAKHVINNYKEALEHYFAIGIVGYARKNIESKKKNAYVQKFLPASEYSYKKDIVLPPTKYFITHPCLDSYLKRTLDTSFYNPFNIIGNTYKFRDRPGMTNIYDVALSYASEERAYVEEIAEYLNQKNIRVFYDKLDKGKLWGSNLSQYLQHVYKYSSRFCVLFISESYLEKKWTNFELKQALERYDSNNKDRYLLPVKFDNVESAELDEIVHLNANEETASEIADLIEANILESKKTFYED